ncbi:hypothetical protein [Epibacterium ulvae]|uniref:hypothetical protein n=1 Tax=Epibacterium ulvae TaxID=1156985 RepID=UPI001BFCA5DD|nr:hypothetical protein [Epibacterium ulvae]
MADLPDGRMQAAQFSTAGESAAKPTMSSVQPTNSGPVCLMATLGFALRCVQVAGLLISTSGGAVLAFGVTLSPSTLLHYAITSGLMVILGWQLFSRAEDWFSPEICFDPDARELRLMRRSRTGEDAVLLRRSFDSLGGVRLEAKRLQVVDRDGVPLAELPIPDRKARALLRDRLSGHLPILS